MSSVLKIKRSSGSNSPSQLAQGELAYSWDESGSFSLGRLWIGTGNETLGAAANIHVIGGKYFTDMLDHTRGALVANSALVTDVNSKLDQLKVDNLDFNNNTISATDANGNITLSPSGTGTVDVSNFKITSVADPVDATDAANKRYVDAARSGLDVKQSVRVATTANITLSGTQTVDGIALVVGDRVLVKDQTTASQNGIYDVASGAWTRSSDADNSPSGEVTSGMFTFVESGTANDNTGFVLATPNPITLGTTSLTFTAFSSAGAITAGAGLSKTGDTLDVNVGGGIEIVSDVVRLATTVAGNGLTLTNGVLSIGTALSLLGGLSPTTDTFAYYTGTNSASLATVTSFARSLLDDVDAAAARTTLGLGTLSTQNANNVTITGGSITNLSTLDGVTLDGGTY